MCGIWGIVTDTPGEDKFKIALNLMKESESRGKEAAGIILVRPDGKYIAFKKPGSPTDFLQEMIRMKKEICSSCIIVGHTRAPTVGKPEDNNNNHPIESEHWLMVHNGGCTNVDKIPDYKYKGEVDSELLLAWVETKGLPGLKKLGKGTAAVALVNKDDPLHVKLWRDTSPTILALSADGKTLVFASTIPILVKSVPVRMGLFPEYTTIETEVYDVYELSVNPLRVEKLEKQHTEVPADTYTSRWSGSYGYAEGIAQWAGWKGTTIRGEQQQETTNRRIDDEFKLVWNTTEKRYIVPEIAPTKLYLKSNDFSNWNKLPSPQKGYISQGCDLVKMYDKTKRQHFIMTVDDAIAEKLFVSKDKDGKEVVS